MFVSMNRQAGAVADWINMLPPGITSGMSYGGGIGESWRHIQKCASQPAHLGDLTGDRSRKRVPGKRMV
jgi:hypothetical protein